MKKLVPYYRVKYNGQFYEAGEGFPIDAEDVDEMKHHGVVYEDKRTAPAAEIITEPKRPGRPRKAVTADDEGQPVKAKAQD